MEPITEPLINWQLWCRLCARSDIKDNVSIFVKSETETIESDVMGATDDTNKNILKAIEQYFMANIDIEDALPKMLCSNCYDLMKTLVSFSDYVKRVQQMFNAMLQSTSETTSSTVQEIRRIYRITDIYNEHDFVKLPLVETNNLETEPIINATNDNLSANEYAINNPLELLEINIGKQEEEDCAEQESLSCNSSMKNLTDVEDDNTDDNVDDRCQDNKDDENSPKRLLGIVPKKKNCSKNSDKTDTVKKSLSCSECPCKFKGKLEYRNHMKYVHCIRPAFDYACKQCSRTFNTEYLLKQHLKTHFMCEKCGKMLKTQKSIEKHMLSHSDSSSLKCQICDQVFDFRYNLEKHMRIQHAFKPNCKECGLKLSSNEALRLHMLVHTDIRHYMCDSCGRAFKTSTALKVHLIMHTGLKPYSCDFCELTFASGSNCRKHEKTVHAQEFAALAANGAVEKKWRTEEIPDLETLKAIVKTGDNLKTVAPKPGAQQADKSENVYSTLYNM